MINFNKIRKGFINIIRIPGIRNTIFLLVVFILASGLFVTLFTSFKDVEIALFEGPLGFVMLKAVAQTTVWPNVFTTVAEQNPSSLPAVISQMGGRFLFTIALLGALFTLVKKDIYGKIDIKYAIM